MSDAVATRQANSLLYDFYGGLLTQKQRTFYEMHYMDDLSLAEVAAEMNITPQAVADVLKRSLKRMQECEEALGVLKKFEEQRDCAQNIHKLLEIIDQHGEHIQELPNLTTKLRKLIDQMLL